MASTTTNYNLNKPELTDNVNNTINSLFTDMQTIDTQIKARETEADALDSRINNLILGSSTSPAECVDARTSGETSVVHSTLKDRLDVMEGLEYDNKGKIDTESISTETTETTKYIDVSSSAIGGTMNVQMEGNTTYNEFENTVAGCESTSGWTTFNTSVATDSAEALGGNCLKITLTSTGGALNRDILSYLDTSKYYFITAHIKNGNASTGVGLDIIIGGDTGTQLGALTTSTSWSRVGAILQPTDFDTATSVVFSVDLYGSVSEYAYLDAIMLQEISASDYSLGVDALLGKYAYHQSVQNVNSNRIKTTGKNIFDVEKYAKSSTNITYDGTNLSTTNTLASVSDYGIISLKPNTQHTLSFDLVTAASVRLQLEGFYFGNTVDTGAVTGDTTFTTGADGVYYIKVFPDTNNLTFKNVQIETGSSATSYEAYTDASAYNPLTLRAVGSVKDTFDCNTGIFTKLIADPVSISSGTAVNTTNYTDAKNGSTFTIYLDAGGKESGTVGSDSASGDGTLYYELARPLSYSYLSDKLNGGGSGNIYNEPIINAFGWYDSGVTIPDSNYPIKTLEAVYRVSPSDGVYTQISLTSCTVAGDGLSFTSTELSDDELVSYQYHYNYVSSIADIKYSYNQNLKAQTNQNSLEVTRLRNLIDALNFMKVSNGGDSIYGNLGIGLTAQHPLHVSGDIVNEKSVEGILYQVIKNTNSTSGQNRFAEMQLQSDNNNVVGTLKAGKDTGDTGTVQIGSGTSHDVLFLVGGTEKARLDTAGAFDAVSYKVGGASGASGSFTTTDGKTITVTNGIITAIV